VSQYEELRDTVLAFCPSIFQLIPEVPNRPSTLLQRFFEEVGEDNLEQLSVGGIARKLDVSTSYLCRVIKAAAGRTPSQYIRLAKLSRARTLLDCTTVTNAALKSGFDKVSSFIELFRKHYGETPGAYKRRMIAGGSAIVPAARGMHRDE
ncbi:MAG: helix-turn-helix transcriptional regulator, partial [Terriglobia bacterium]